MERTTLIVGGGMAGLTAAAYLAKAGKPVTLCEAQDNLGGLVANFDRKGFRFDAGIRAIENSGIVRPMLAQLGIDLEFLPSTVSVGIGSDLVRLKGRESLTEYQGLLERAFPGQKADVARIVDEVRKVMGYMEVLYGIDNPLFLDLKANPEYVRKTILPWMLKYLLTMPKVSRLMLPVEAHLETLTRHQALLDLVAQHFFKATPAYFALSYFSLYLDYAYPRGGTGSLPKALADFGSGHGATLLTGRRITKIDLRHQVATDASGQEYPWDRLIWTADQKTLYEVISPDSTLTSRDANALSRWKKRLAPLRGGDSVFSLYLASSLPPEFFAARASAHFFFTPSATGISACLPKDWTTREGLEAWVASYLALTTYEVSFPVLRDPALAPPGKTGIVASTLLEYDFFKRAKDLGCYEEIKKLCASTMVQVLEAGAFPGLAASLEDSLSASPLSIEALTGNCDGAITGWAFTNRDMPSVHKLPAIAGSIRTPFPGVYQAGQWTFSPSGLPISILTGKLAADRVVKDLRRQENG